MGLGAMKYNYPGLLREKHRNGKERWRVRKQGDPKVRIDIYVSPDHDEFMERYRSARAGIAMEAPVDAYEALPSKCLGRLRIAYMEHFERRVEAGLSSPKTLKKKRNLLDRLAKYDEYPVNIPQKTILQWQDEMMHVPAQADAFVSAIRGMYKWGIKYRLATKDPTNDVPEIYVKGDGATPWTAEDVKAYFKRHPIGTKQHTALSCLLWTGCRIGDLLILGRHCERILDNEEAISFQPQKRGSTLVEMPFLEPLKQSTRALKVIGEVYVLGKGNKPYKSEDSISATFVYWCKQAGLKNRSAHGVRKGLAELLVEMGCTQYEIMAILGHSEAKTSEVYTRRADRWKLARQAVNKLKVSQTMFLYA